MKIVKKIVKISLSILVILVLLLTVNFLLLDYSYNNLGNDFVIIYEDEITDLQSNQTNLIINDEFVLKLDNSTNLDNRTLVIEHLQSVVDRKVLLDKDLVNHYDLVPDSSIEWLVPLTPKFILNYIKED